MTINMMPAILGGNSVPFMKYVGSFAANFAASTTATATVLGANLGPQNNDKQILVAWRSFTGVVNPIGATINGVAASTITAGQDSVGMASAYYAGTANFNVVVSVATAITENGFVDVWEFVNARPLYEGLVNNGAFFDVIAPLLTRAPKDSFIVGAGLINTDSVTATWSVLTEVTDIDAGSYRNIAAIGGPTLSPFESIISVTPSVSDGVTFSLLSVLKKSTSLSTALSCSVRSAPMANLFVATTTSTFTVAARPNALNFTGLGSFTLYALLSVESDITVSGVTFNGNAMSLVGSAANTAASPDLRTYAYKIAVTQASPSGNLVVTYSSSASGSVGVTLVRVYGGGTDQTIQSISGNAIGAAVNVTVAEGGVILAVTARATDTQVVTWSGVMDPDTAIDAGSHAHSTAMRPYCGAEAGRAVQASGDASGQYVTMAFAINP